MLNLRNEAFMEKNVLWRDLYAAAMLELDHAKLGKRIQEAQAAIQAAIGEQLAAPANRSAEELQALNDATYNLLTLQRIELCIPVQASKANRSRLREATS
jgi:hypothetical protein